MPEIILFGNKTTSVDEVDYWRLMQYNWFEAKGRRGQLYAKCNTWPYLMHLFIIGYKDSCVVDHIDGNGLNNQRSNLRHITNAQNIQRQPRVRGKSQYKGVYYLERLKSKPWKAEIVVNRNKIHLGYFSTEKEAAKAYDNAALKWFGESAGLNL